MNAAQWAALGAALSWSCCSLAFAAAGRRVGAWAVNQIRIVLAVLGLSALHLATFGTLWPAMSAEHAWMLLASGFIGLALGDLCYFEALQTLGPRLGLLLHGTWPVMAAALAWTAGGEEPLAGEIAGILLVVVGTSVVVTEGDRSWRLTVGHDRGVRWPVTLGLLGALGQALGAVMAKGPLGSVDPLAATHVRMVAGASGMVLATIAMRRVRAVARASADVPAMGRIAIGTALGPILGVWLSMVAIQGADTGVAAALMATAPLWMLPIGRVAYGTAITARALLGTSIAVTGGALLV